MPKTLMGSSTNGINRINSSSHQFQMRYAPVPHQLLAMCLLPSPPPHLVLLPPVLPPVLPPPWSTW